MAATIIMNKSQAWKWSRIIIGQWLVLKEPTFTIPKPPHDRLSSSSRGFSTAPYCFPTSQTTTTTAATTTPYYQKLPFPNSWLQRRFSFGGNRFFCSDEEFHELLAELEREKQSEREERKWAGLDTADIDAEDEEDYMGVGPLIEKLEKEKLKYSSELDTFEEPTDSDSEDEDELFAPADTDELSDEFEEKFEIFEDLLDNFSEAESLDDAHKWMKEIDEYEHKHFHLRPEYRVIGELMNRMKVATGKDRFILQQKLNRAIRLMEWKENYDPNNPENYGIIQLEDQGPAEDLPDDAEFDKEGQIKQGDGVDEEEEEEEDGFDDMREKDDVLLEKLNVIDKKLEQKLAELDHTFGKKGRVLEGEIRDLAEERNSLIEKKREPLCRKVSKHCPDE